jgi:hypothetical protein
VDIHINRLHVVQPRRGKFFEKRQGALHIVQPHNEFLLEICEDRGGGITDFSCVCVWPSIFFLCAARNIEQLSEFWSKLR